MSEEPIELIGSMILEGPFLELVMASYLLKKGENIVPRLETGGISHDILVKKSDGFVLYECTGQRDIGEDKIDKFHWDIIRLHDALKKLEGKGIIEAVFVASVIDDAWQPSAKEALTRIEHSLKRRVGANLRVFSGLNLLKELVACGVLGLRLFEGKVHFAGPEDYAIRYDPKNGEFRMSFAPVDLVKFRELPHSFLPSYYWETYYRELYQEVAEDKNEPLTIWSYIYNEGVKWSSSRDLVKAYYEYLTSEPRTYTLEMGDDYLIEEYKSRRRNYYYSIHMFSCDEKFNSQVAGRLTGKAIRLIDDIKHKREYLEEMPFSIHIHSSTEAWSSKAWGELRKGIPEVLHKEISYINAERGNDLLIRMLNWGILGLHFKSRNELTLVGPGVEAIRRTKVDHEISVSKGYE